MAYQLTKDLETGNAVIDGEHRELFNAVNNLLDACGSGKGRDKIEPTIKFLLDYVEKHFSHEEELQRKSNYPGLNAHVNFHKSYKATLKDIAASIPAGGPSIADVAKLNSHVGVLVSHIRTEDKRVGAHLNNN